MPARLSAFVIWALVAAGLVFWGLRLGARPLAAPANALMVSEAVGARGDLTRLLGAAPVAAMAAPPPVAESSRFRLLGVLAPRQKPDPARRSSAGVALIAVDGKPARPYAVGTRLDGDLVLQSITRRTAAIGPAQGSASLTLELPPPLAPTSGTLPRLSLQPPPPAAAEPPPVIPSPIGTGPSVMQPPRPQPSIAPEPNPATR